MLFLVNSSGVPSVAKFLHMSNASAPATPSLSMSRTYQNFPTPQAPGTTSGAYTIVATNLGVSAITFNSMSINGPDFSISSSNCGSSLAAGANCRINVVFHPTTAGQFKETLTITDSDPSSPQLIQLTGTGTGLQFSATSFNLGTVVVGTTGSSKATLTLTNVGSTPITFTSLVYSNPEYRQDPSSTCGSSLAASASCIIYISFTPSTTGTRTGTLVITDSDPSSPSTISLTGSGQ